MTYIIGYPDAAVANDCVEMLASNNRLATILTPESYFNQQYDPTQKFLIAVTREMEFRKKIITTLDERQLKRDTYIHPTAVIHPSAKIGAGTIICQFSTALWNTTIDQDCFMAPYTMVAHGSFVGQGSFLQPGTIIAGSTKVGKYCTFGLRSNVIDHLTICDNVIVGATGLITKDITQPGVYLGSPARKVAN